MKKRQKQPEISDKYNEKLNEMYRPDLIHSTISMILTDQILGLMPSDRNVILTMNEYKLNELNPYHPSDPDAPTDVIIFCIRFISDDIFQPIGGLCTYRNHDQSYVIAQAVKAYIYDLWKLGLFVIASVSPPSDNFKKIIGHLIEIPDITNYADVISYSVPPVRQVIHIYDIQFLLIKLQSLYKDSDIRFEEESIRNKRVYQASWADISLVLNLTAEFKMILEVFLTDKQVSRRVHIFTDQIYTKLLNAELQGLLSVNARGSVVLINTIRTFLRFTEQNFVDVKAMNHVKYWDSLTDILKTMKFHKTKSTQCTKEQQNNEAIALNPAIRRKIDFQDNELNNSGSSASLEAASCLGSSKSRSKRSRRKKVGKKSGSVTELNQQDTKACKKVASSIDSNDKLDSKSQKTDNVVENVDNKVKISNVDQNCDIDSNNNSDDGQKAEPKKLKKKKCKFSEDNFDVVIDNPEAFLRCLTDVDSFQNRDPPDNVQHVNKPLSFNKLKNSNYGTCSANLENISQLPEANTNIVIRDHDYAKSESPMFSSSTPLPECEALLKCEQEDFDAPINSVRNNCLLSGKPEAKNNPLLYGLCNMETHSPTNSIDDLATDFDISLNMSDQGHVLVPEEHNSSSTITISPDTMKASIAMATDIFSSKSDEETENSIKESCDKVPNILELLSNAEKSPTVASASEFEEHPVTSEMLCTVYGIEKLMEIFYHRRIRLAKPNAFFVEHIDFFVTSIKEKNRLPVNPYYGQGYNLLNSELGFSALEENKGLMTVMKD